MEKQTFSITIDAPREKVWDTLWKDESYRAWTSAFSENSYAETDWQTGSKVRFLDGKGSGMVSTIAENRPTEYMSIRHLGMVKDGVEDTSSEEVKQWAGALENYTLTGIDGKTELVVDLEVNADWKEYMQSTWPKALQRLKELAEKR